MQRLKSDLARSSNASVRVHPTVLTKRRIDAAALDDFANFLLTTGLVLETAAAAIPEKRRTGRFHFDIAIGEAKEIVADQVEKVLGPMAKALAIDVSLNPHVVLVVGINGTGTTTTIGKLAAKLRAEGRSVVLSRQRHLSGGGHRSAQQDERGSYWPALLLSRRFPAAFSSRRRRCRIGSV